MCHTVGFKSEISKEKLMTTVISLPNMYRFAFASMDLAFDDRFNIVDKVEDVLEDKLWKLLNTLKKTYRSLKSNAIKGYKKLPPEVNRLSNFLHARKPFERSRLSKLLMILCTILSIISAIYKVYTAGPVFTALTILETVLPWVAALV